MISAQEHWDRLYKMGHEVPLALIEFIQADAMEYAIFDTLRWCSSNLQDSMSVRHGINKIERRIEFLEGKSGKV